MVFKSEKEDGSEKEGAVPDKETWQGGKKKALAFLVLKRKRCLRPPPIEQNFSYFLIVLSNYYTNPKSHMINNNVSTTGYQTHGPWLAY